MGMGEKGVGGLYSVSLIELVDLRSVAVWGACIPSISG